VGQMGGRGPAGGGYGYQQGYGGRGAGGMMQDGGYGGGYGGQYPRCVMLGLVGFHLWKTH
jgi:hypothetical protein